MSKLRLDQLLVSKGLFTSRASAKGAIMAGQVQVAGVVVSQAGKQVSADSAIQVTRKDDPYVSRAGKKLRAALDELALDVTGLVVLDAGASTGGFVDCLLDRGAAKVIAVDVGYGLLDWSLRNDPRVEVHERTNLRYINLEDISGPVDLVTLDLSFISLDRVLPAVKRCLRQGGEILALVKPQFEVGKGKVGKGGIVRDVSLHREALEKVAGISRQEEQLGVLAVVPSMLPGAKGNVEYWLRMSLSGVGLVGDDFERALDDALVRGESLIS